MRLHVIFSGRVQGVSFRYYTQKKALQIGLKGWVKNLRNGNVEAVFEGEENKIKEILEYCKSGQAYAKVNYLNTKEEKEEGLKNFEIIY